MTNRTEANIMNHWKGQTDLPLVTIRCAAYNQENYIEQAMDSFLSQKTDFPFLIVVHDDASLDRTTELIRKYEKKYPHIVKALYEMENQHTGKSVLDVMEPYFKGKYVAVCEGDDYWCDNQKLQRQFDFMEQHPECSMCVHNSVYHCVDGRDADRNFNEWSEIRRLEEDDVFFGWKVHMSSYFYRRGTDFRPDCIRRLRFWSGDYRMLTLAMYYGDVYCLPEVMSVYNANIKSGVTMRNQNRGYSFFTDRVQRRIEYLKVYNQYTGGKFADAVMARIAEDILQISDDRSEMVKAAKQMSHSPIYKKIVEGLAPIQKLKNSWKYRRYLLEPLWYRSILWKHQKMKK